MMHVLAFGVALWVAALFQISGARADGYCGRASDGRTNVFTYSNGETDPDRYCRICRRSITECEFPGVTESPPNYCYEPCDPAYDQTVMDSGRCTRSNWNDVEDILGISGEELYRCPTAGPGCIGSACPATVFPTPTPAPPPPPAPVPRGERLDGADNDFDGLVDEGFAAGSLPNELVLCFEGRSVDIVQTYFDVSRGATFPPGWVHVDFPLYWSGHTHVPRTYPIDPQLLDLCEDLGGVIRDMSRPAWFDNSFDSAYDLKRAAKAAMQVCNGARRSPSLHCQSAEHQLMCAMNGTLIALTESTSSFSGFLLYSGPYAEDEAYELMMYLGGGQFGFTDSGWYHYGPFPDALMYCNLPSARPFASPGPR